MYKDLWEMATLAFSLEGKTGHLGPKEPWDGAERQALEGHPVPSQIPGLLQAVRQVESGGSLVSESPWGDNRSPSIDEK